MAKPIFVCLRIATHYTGTPAFKAVFDTIENKFWDKNKQIRATLEEKGLL